MFSSLLEVPELEVITKKLNANDSFNEALQRIDSKLINYILSVLSECRYKEASIVSTMMPTASDDMEELLAAGLADEEAEEVKVEGVTGHQEVAGGAETAPPDELGKADIYLLADTTGSMGSVFDAVKDGAAVILAGAPPGVDRAFGVGNYSGATTRNEIGHLDRIVEENAP